MRHNRLRVATAVVSNTIYAGYPAKSGDGLREPRHDVTSDVIKAVIDHVGVGKEMVVTENGEPKWCIAIKPFSPPQT